MGSVLVTRKGLNRGKKVICSKEESGIDERNIFKFPS